MKKFFRTIYYIATIYLVVISCTDIWNLNVDGENSDVAHTLCVAANATIVGGELSFAAAVAPVRSDVLMFDSFPLDGLRLELVVDGVSYHTDSLERNDLFNDGYGFRISGIPIESVTPFVEMTIKDILGNYNTVKASATALKAPEMEVEVSATKVKKKLNPSLSPGIESMITIPPLDPWDVPYSHNGCDSIYTATLKFKDPPGMKNYYMVSLEFECFEDIFDINSGQNKVFQYLRVTDQRVIGSFGTHDSARWKKMGFFPFTSEDNVFYDDKITSSIFGYEVHFCNVFDDSTFDGKEKSVTISFENLFPQICKTDMRERIFHQFSSNAETPFHIYLSYLTFSDYINYKRLIYHLCSSMSLFDVAQAFSSNIEGGVGYFTVTNSNDFFYYDDTVYYTPLMT